MAKKTYSLKQLEQLATENNYNFLSENTKNRNIKNINRHKNKTTIYLKNILLRIKKIKKINSIYECNKIWTFL